MSQFFFTPLSFQAARNRYRDRLKEMDAILFPSGDKSLLSHNMSAEIADKALEDALESRLGQGTVSGNLVFFARTFSEGKLNPGLDKSVQELILFIADNRDILEKGINQRSTNQALRVMLAPLCGVVGGVVGGFLAGYFVGRLSVSAKTTTLAASKPLAFIGTRLSSPVPVSDGSPWPLILFALILLTALVILSVSYGKKKAAKGHEMSSHMIGNGTCDEKQAREILTLAICLADIYRDKKA